MMHKMYLILIGVFSYGFNCLSFQNHYEISKLSLNRLLSYTRAPRFEFHYRLKETLLSHVALSTAYSDEMPLPRKSSQHRNKYDKFSKAAALDPLEEALLRAEREESAARIDLNAPVRGTTVPTLSSSPSKSKLIESRSIARASKPIGPSSTASSSSINHISYNTVVPTDPFTFGYVEIGVVNAPHGVNGEVKVRLETDFGEERLRSGAILYVKKPSRRTPRPIEVAAGRKQNGDVFLVKFKNISSRLGAAAFKGYTIYVKEEDRPSLLPDEFLIRDLVGMDCYLSQEKSRGTEEEITEYKRGSLLGRLSKQKQKSPPFLETESCSRTGPEVLRETQPSVFLQGSAPVARVVGVVPPDELCDPAAAKLMHAMLELQNLATDDLCLIPFVPSIVLFVDQSARRMVISPPSGLLDLTYREKKKKIAIRGFLPEKASHLSDVDRLRLEMGQRWV